MATGRSPNSKNLNLNSVGIEAVKGYIPVDDQMRVVNGEKIIKTVSDSYPESIISASKRINE